MQLSFTEYGKKLELNLLKQLVYIFFCVYTLYVLNMSSKHLALRLMAFGSRFNGFLSTYRRIRRYLETIHSISDETGIITNDLYLTCTDN